MEKVLKIETNKKGIKNIIQKIFLILAVVFALYFVWFGTSLSYGASSDNSPNVFEPLTPEEQKELNEENQKEIDKVNASKDLSDAEKQDVIDRINTCTGMGREWVSQGIGGDGSEGACGDRANQPGIFTSGSNDFRIQACIRDGGEWKDVADITETKARYRCVFEELEKGTVNEGPISSSEDWNCGFPGKDSKYENPTNFIEEMKKLCWFCKPLNTGIKAIEDLSKDVYDSVKNGVASLMAIIFAIWLVIKLIGYIAVQKYKGADEFYTELGEMAFKVGIAAIILLAGTEIWKYTVSPLSAFVFDYGSAAIEGANSVTIGKSSQNVEIPSGGALSVNPVDVVGQKMIGEGANAGGIIKLINQRIMEFIAFGWIMLSAAMYSSVFCHPFSNFLLFMFALFLLGVSVYFLILIPLKLAEIIFRLGVFLVLMPLFIAAWPFPISRDFTQKGVRLLLNVMMNLLMYVIIVTLCTALIYESIDFPDLADDPEKVRKTLVNDFLSWEKVIMVFLYVLFTNEITKQINMLAGRLVDAGYQESGVVSSKDGEASGINKAFNRVRGALTPKKKQK